MVNRKALFLEVQQRLIEKGLNPEVEVAPLGVLVLKYELYLVGSNSPLRIRITLHPDDVTPTLLANSNDRLVMPASIGSILDATAIMSAENELRRRVGRQFQNEREYN